MQNQETKVGEVARLRYFPHQQGLAHYYIHELPRYPEEEGYCRREFSTCLYVPRADNGEVTHCQRVQQQEYLERALGFRTQAHFVPQKDPKCQDGKPEG